MISVIVPVLNEAENLPLLMAELEPSDDLEVIVVDGGSSDGGPGALPETTRLVTSEPGRGKQMNAGAQIAEGNILLFLHADTRLPARAGELITHALRDPDIIGGRFRLRLDSDEPAFRIIAWMINIRDGLFGGFAGDQAIFINKDAFIRLEGYKDIPIMEDLDLARRMQRLGEVCRLPAAVTTSARRWERKGVIRTILTMWLMRASFFLGVSPLRMARMYGDVR